MLLVILDYIDRVYLLSTDISTVLLDLQMVPLCNVSFSGITFNLHQRSDYLNSSATFSLAARSYNDKYDSWEPLLEPVDGLLRFFFFETFVNFPVLLTLIFSLQ